MLRKILSGEIGPLGSSWSSGVVREQENERNSVTMDRMISLMSFDGRDNFAYTFFTNFHDYLELSSRILIET